MMQSHGSLEVYTASSSDSMLPLEDKTTQAFTPATTSVHAITQAPMPLRNPRIKMPLPVNRHVATTPASARTPQTSDRIPLVWFGRLHLRHRGKNREWHPFGVPRFLRCRQNPTPSVAPFSHRGKHSREKKATCKNATQKHTRKRRLSPKKDPPMRR